MMLSLLEVADVDMIWMCSVPEAAGVALAAASPAPLSAAATEIAVIAVAIVFRMFLSPRLAMSQTGTQLSMTLRTRRIAVNVEIHKV